jgi:hypothetical protein
MKFNQKQLTVHSTSQINIELPATAVTRVNTAVYDQPVARCVTATQHGQLYDERLPLNTSSPLPE